MSHTDAELAAHLASHTGVLLLDVRREYGGGDPDDLGAAGDRAAQRYLASKLATARPADWVLSEEAADHADRLSADRVWIVDPLDGTREFAEGRHDWAVHVALWSHGQLVAGAVALPARSETLTSDPPPPLRPRHPGPIRLAVSRSRPPEVAEMMARHLGAELVPMGSAGYKAAAVVRGDADAYVHAGGQYEWDSAAPVAVARAAGLHASRLDGSPLRYNTHDLYLPDLLIARPEVADSLLSISAPGSSRR